MKCEPQQLLLLHLVAFHETSGEKNAGPARGRSETRCILLNCLPILPPLHLYCTETRRRRLTPPWRQGVSRWVYTLRSCLLGNIEPTSAWFNLRSEAHDLVGLQEQCTPAVNFQICLKIITTATTVPGRGALSAVTAIAAEHGLLLWYEGHVILCANKRLAPLYCTGTTVLDFVPQLEARKQ